MGILNELTHYLPEEEIEKVGFEMQLPDEEEGDAYSVTKNGKLVCKVEFISDTDDQSADVDSAQLNPEEHTVYITDIEDKAGTAEYKKKLAGMGFERISVDTI